MASTPPKPLANWLQHQSVQINALLGQVHLLRRISDAVRNALPEPLASHCHAANINGDTLVLGCDSSTWAAKLRYHIPLILTQLKGKPELPVFSHVRVRVQPPPGKERSRTSNRRLQMSEHSAALITSVADNTADPELKAALLRLSKRIKPEIKP